MVIAQIIDIDYNIKDNEESEIILCIREKNGEKRLIRKLFLPYFYVKTENENQIKELANENQIKIKTYDSDMKNLENQALIKVEFKNPKILKRFRDILDKNNITNYESDIRLIYRYLIDNDIKHFIKIENSEIKPYNGTLKDMPIVISSIDIETIDDEICMVSIITHRIYYSDNTEKIKKLKIDSIILNKDNKNSILKNTLKNTEYHIVNNEKQIIKKTQEILNQINPDILTGWNVIDFDLNHIIERAKKHKISFRIGQPLYGLRRSLRLKRNHQFLRSSNAKALGIVIIDGINLVRSSFIKLEEYNLNYASKKLLGKTKIDIGSDKKEGIKKAYSNNINKLIEYNIKDSQLVLEIIEKYHLIKLLIERAKATGLPLDKVNASIVALDSLYLRKSKKRKIVLNRVRYNERGQSISGGYVRNPIPGLYDFINVLDFKSLYPSIIRTFNIDPIEFGKEGITAPNGASFSKNKAILPEIIDELFEKRNHAKQLNRLLESQALKITMNSFFGVLANPNCRLFNPKVADAITSFGREVSKTAGNYVIKKGFDVIYGDTDSIFVKSNAQNYNEAVKIGKLQEKEINNFLKEWCNEKYNVESKLIIEYEKTYLKLLLPGSGNQGIKKRYAGLLLKNNKEIVTFTGLESVRSDWTELAKEFQHKLLWNLFHDKNVEQYIKETIEQLKKGNLDNKLIYRKKIRKKLNEYTKTTPPHVKAARKLNKITSPVIKYIITINGPEPIEDLRSRIDYEHYINKQLKPIANQILSYYNKNFDDILNGKQKSIFDF